MWKEYSVSYLKNNRSAGISIMIAALISSLCLSFIVSLFFNLWVSEIDSIVRDQGGWHGRITGAIAESELVTIENFANVEQVVVNSEAAEGTETVVDVYFENLRTVFADMPLITAELGLSEDAAEYNLQLLSRYLVHDPSDESPPLLMMFYLGVIIIIAVSLILVIHNSFALTMQARLHQFGIFSSIGATPKQIRTCLVQEALTLCLMPVILGDLLGIAASCAVMQVISNMADRIPGAYASPLSYHPFIFVITFLISILTVLFSAWIPARKLSKVTPLEAILGSSSMQLKKGRKSRILGAIFGIEGELAGNAMKAQKKAWRTSTLSLTLSFLAFSFILCFFTLSQISTRYTYFAKYQDVWDVMVTVKNTGIEDFDRTPEISVIAGVEDCTVYQKATASVLIPEPWQSEELQALGGLKALTDAVETADGYSVAAPLVVLDDQSYLRYCEKLGIEPRLDGTIILNQIWDSLNSNFRYREYLPFLQENRDTIQLQGAADEPAVELPVLAYTTTVPVLREEYADYTLVQFIPLSVWNELAVSIESEADTYIRVLAQNRNELAAAEALEDQITAAIGVKFKAESENRIGDKIINDYMIMGYLTIMGGFCVLLAIIGIANVFSNTMGFITQRKRELAQYMSVGMSPRSIRKMFCIEALIIAGRPLLITLPLVVIFVQFTAAASYLNPLEFWAEAPFIPLAAFCLAIIGFVALAYYIGGKRLLCCNLNEILRKDMS